MQVKLLMSRIIDIIIWCILYLVFAIGLICLIPVVLIGMILLLIWFLIELIIWFVKNKVKHKDES